MSAENLKKSLTRTRGWILNVQWNILNFPADRDKIRVTNPWGKIDNILLRGKTFQGGCEL